MNFGWKSKKSDDKIVVPMIHAGIILRLPMSQYEELKTFIEKNYPDAIIKSLHVNDNRLFLKLEERRQLYSVGERRFRRR